MYQIFCLILPRYLSWTSLPLVALAVAALGVVQNARYGGWLDAASGSQTVSVFGTAIGGLGVTFAILNLFKVMLPPAIIETWQRGHRGIATVVSIGFVGLAGLSIWNITALQTIARDDKETGQQVERQKLATLRDDWRIRSRTRRPWVRRDCLTLSSANCRPCVMICGGLRQRSAGRPPPRPRVPFVRITPDYSGRTFPG